MSSRPSMTSPRSWRTSGARVSSRSAPPPDVRSRREAQGEVQDGPRAHEVALLEFRAAVRGPAPVIRRLRACLPEPAAWATRPPRESARFDVLRDVPHPGWHRIERNGEAMFQTDRPGDIVPYLAWAINWEAVDRLTRRYVLLHAGAVAWNGRALLFPADSGSGKTTLVAGM